MLQNIGSFTISFSCLGNFDFPFLFISLHFSIARLIISIVPYHIKKSNVLAFLSSPQCQSSILYLAIKVVFLWLICSMSLPLPSSPHLPLFDCFFVVLFCYWYWSIRTHRTADASIRKRKDPFLSSEHADKMLGIVFLHFQKFSVNFHCNYEDSASIFSNIILPIVNPISS